MLITLGLKRGGNPKCSCQLSLAPSRMMMSQDEIARERAADTQQGWVSSNTPLPIGVGRKGSWVWLMNSLVSALALATTQPFPIKVFVN